MGKILYRPKGKAEEYAPIAANFFNGCNHGCTYCYLKRGVLSSKMGGGVRYKKGLDNIPLQMQTLKREISKFRAAELSERGVFMSFSCDPCVPETWQSTANAIDIFIANEIPVTLLTKSVYALAVLLAKRAEWAKWVKIGFTLTDADELEPNAAPHAIRISAIEKLHKAGYKTWASVEPIISLEKAKVAIKHAAPFINHFAVGAMSGRKTMTQDEARSLLSFIPRHTEVCTVYVKDSLLCLSDMSRDILHDISPIYIDNNKF